MKGKCKTIRDLKSFNKVKKDNHKKLENEENDTWDFIGAKWSREHEGEGVVAKFRQQSRVNPLVAKILYLDTPDMIRFKSILSSEELEDIYKQLDDVRNDEDD